MMGTSYIDNLLSKIEDQSLRSQLTNELNKLRDNKEFGLVFERHIPEYVRLYKKNISEGTHVQLMSSKSDDIFTVKEIEGEKAIIADKDGSNNEEELADLVAVIRHGNSIYPGLVEVDRVDRGGNKPFHAVINAENYHALQLLLYTHEGKIDCIYIDPPYNTGAKDWKYNNDYVDSEDRYRHSKWLSFMEKRLLLAKRLLNPTDSLLICTIDEKEYLRLGLLLEEMFPHSHIQMVSSNISSKGAAREIGINRVDEYIFFVFNGAAKLSKLDPKFCGHERVAKKTQVWYPMIRTGTDSSRNRSPGCFFPVLVNPSNGKIEGCGEALEKSQKLSDYKAPDGLIAFFPIAKDGSESRWQVTPNEFRKRHRAGTIKLGSRKVMQDRPIMYIRSGMAKRIESGEIKSSGINSLGVLEVESFQGTQIQNARSQWNNISHDASLHGSSLNKKFLPSAKFPFPKSLYAVEDTLRWYLHEKRNSIVLDFFAGSGTTAHAVLRLNRQDKGTRSSISITNNSVSFQEQKNLAKQNFRPGDDAFEEKGIFNSITMPRIKAALTGYDNAGNQINGKYAYTDVFPMKEGFDENIRFLELIYVDYDMILRNRSFHDIAHILWLKSGGKGSVIEQSSSSFTIQDEGNYGVLFDISYMQEFVNEVKQMGTIIHAFIVTDSKVQFKQVVKILPTNIESTMLYEDYLRNFQVRV